MSSRTNIVMNPLKGLSPYGWHFEQAVYDTRGIARAIKAGGGSGNIPKIIERFPTKNSNEKNKPICLNSQGGRKGIEGLQPSLKDRVYDTDGIACAVTTSEFFMPNYLIIKK